MEKHGFVVLTETGAIRDAYVRLMELLKGFFDGGPEFKESCKGGVHFNERGIPMVGKVLETDTAIGCVSLLLSHTVPVCGAVRAFLILFCYGFKSDKRLLIY